MKSLLFYMCCFIAITCQAQKPFTLGSCRYSSKFTNNFQDISFNDASWGVYEYDTSLHHILASDSLFTRFTFQLDDEFLNASPRKDSFKIILPYITIGAQYWLNGHRIYPKISNAGNEFRLSMILKYLNPVGRNIFSAAIFFRENAVRFSADPPIITMLPFIDAIDMEFQEGRADQNQRNVLISNRLGMKIEGNLYIEIKDLIKDTVLQTFNRSLTIAPYEFILHPAILRKYSPMQVTAIFTEKYTKISKKIVIQAGHK